MAKYRSKFAGEVIDATLTAVRMAEQESRGKS